MVQSFEIGEHDFGQLPTFESNYPPNNYKLQNMSLIIIQQLYTKDDASKSLLELSFLRISILGCDRDVDDDEDAGVNAAVQNPCHSLDRQFLQDEFVFFDQR